MLELHAQIKRDYSVGKECHGGWKHHRRTWRSWKSMRFRCYDPKAKHYMHYGGRGIIVCERWIHSFENFLADMGDRPDGASLDRFPNLNGNYEPGNCRWATRHEQRENMHDTRFIEHNGERMSSWEWSLRLGATSYNLVNTRIRRGWSEKRAIETPIVPLAKLSDKDVLAIRNHPERGIRGIATLLSKQFNVSQGIITRIWNNKLWSEQ